MRQHNLVVLAALTALPMSASLAGAVARPEQRRTYRHPPSSRGFDPNINRWTGQPHEHRREIARRLRQQS